MISDDDVMRYVDGEIDESTRATIDHSLASDPALVQRIARARAVRAQLASVFDPVLKEPVPDRLMALLRTPSNEMPSNVTPLPTSKRAAAVRARWSWHEWGAMAASLILGIVASRGLNRSSELPLVGQVDQSLVARGPLDAALTNQLGTDTDREIRVPVTFTAAGGQLCRAFTVVSAGGWSGVACRRGATWTLDALDKGADPASTEAYRMAGAALPASILATVDSLRRGEPLDENAEVAAKARGWSALDPVR